MFLGVYQPQSNALQPERPPGPHPRGRHKVSAASPRPGQPDLPPHSPSSSRAVESSSRSYRRRLGRAERPRSLSAGRLARRRSCTVRL